VKVEEKKRLAWEVKQQRRHEDLRTWEYNHAKAEENNIRRETAECEGMTSETWSLPRP
jgi:hypothetical protein